MGSQISTHISQTSVENQQINQYLEYISENKKKRFANFKSTKASGKNCLPCSACTDFFSKNVDWRNVFRRECSLLKDKFYWAFYLPDFLSKKADLNRDKVYVFEVSWALYLSEDFPFKTSNATQKKFLLEISEDEDSILNKEASLKLYAEESSDLSQKTEKKLEPLENVNIFQNKSDLLALEHNSTILKIDEKIISPDISAQNELHDFSCPSQFIKYEENTLILENNQLQKIEEKKEDFQENLSTYKRILCQITKHMKDPKNALAVIKEEYIQYFLGKYDHLKQIEFRTSTSKGLKCSYESMLNDVRQFIRVFKECITNFYDLKGLEKSFNTLENVFFTDDNIINFILNVIFTKDEFYTTIFELQRKLDRFNELIFKRNLKMTKNCTPENFSVPDRYCLNEKTLNTKGSKHKKFNTCSPLLMETNLIKEKAMFTPYNNCVEMLKNLIYLKSPAHKIKLLVKVSETVKEEIEEFYEKHGIYTNEKINLNPEEFLAIMIFIVTKVRINSLISQCNFMEKFMTQSDLTEKNGYYFYMFKAAVEYVLNESE